MNPDASDGGLARNAPDRHIRVLIADDHEIVRIGWRAVLKRADDIELVGEASDGREAVELAERVRPDVIVMDLEMPNVDGRAALADIVASGIGTRVLILTMHDEARNLVPLIRAGAMGYLDKSTADHELVEAIRIVSRGGLFVKPSGMRLLMAPPPAPDPRVVQREAFNQLSQRDRELVLLIARGFSAVEIGQQLNMSPKSVSTAREQIGRRLGIGHRSEYLQFALRLGLLGTR